MNNENKNKKYKNIDNNRNNVRVLALYLPQFHPIKENDEIWGKGFTEWTNVAKAKPLFKNHYQPQIPSELGFYDLRLEEIREEQAKLAKDYGIEGFCYWHYWFGNGKKVLEKPFEKVLNSGKPDFPFCLAWANHSWSTSTWNNAEKKKNVKTIFKQEYFGEHDYIEHFNYVLPAFLDSRYIKVDGKPIFAIFNPRDIPEDELKLFISIWNNLARQNGLNGVHFVARLETVSVLTDKRNKEVIKGNFNNLYKKYLDLGFDAIWPHNLRRAEIISKGFFPMFTKRVLYHTFKIRIPDIYDYGKVVNNLYTEDDSKEYVYPTIIPRFDKTPRQGKLAFVLKNSTPEKFENSVKKVVELVKNKDYDHRIIFLQAWNEWGEGNYMEPDLKYGRSYLEALKEGLKER